MDWLEESRAREERKRVEAERAYAEARRVADEAISRSRESGEPVVLEWTPELSDCLLWRSNGWDATALHTSWFSGHDERSPRTGRWRVSLIPELLEGHRG